MIEDHSYPTAPRPGGEAPHPPVRHGLAFLTVLMAVGVDAMLQGLELSTMFLATFVSLLVALALILPITLIQRYSFGDNWPLALGKSLCVAILTAIPTALPSAITLAWGIAGVVEIARARNSARNGVAFKDSHIPPHDDDRAS
jgi:hypothetical protein